MNFMFYFICRTFFYTCGRGRETLKVTMRWKGDSIREGEEKNGDRIYMTLIQKRGLFMVERGPIRGNPGK